MRKSRFIISRVMTVVRQNEIRLVANAAAVS
jgi:hypothetical protein